MLALVLLGCGSTPDGPSLGVGDVLAVPGANDRASLSGAGSTFVEPLLRQWIERYRALAPGVTVDYEGTNSVDGIDRLIAGEGDFVTSDFPLTEVEEATLGGSDTVVQIPWAAGAIAVAYNLPDVGALRLSPSAVAGIFSGRITRWSHPEIRADNADARLPDLPISVVYRSDEAGTTWIFTSYLSRSDSGWELGRASRVGFPTGSGVVGSEAVAAAVARTVGAVGYVQLGLARGASLGVARLGNRSGRFVEPTPEAVNATLGTAAIRAYGTTANLNFDPQEPAAYPLSTFSYLLFRRAVPDPDKAAALRRFASWALSEGQRMAEPLGYARVARAFQLPALRALQKT